jgi:uncharacterized membrane protein YgaE (UPF0421/DUF939 family)
MTQKTHYGNNIYILHRHLMILDEALNLEVDDYFYKDKAFEDIYFIHTRIHDLLTYLQEHRKAVRKTEYVQDLVHVLQRYSQLLNGIILENYTSARLLSPHFHKLKEFRDFVQERLENLSENIPQQLEQPSLVSEEEISFLLQDSEDSSVD